MHELLKHNQLMNKLISQKQTQVVSCVVEGNSLRSTVRMTDVYMMTVLKLLHDIGGACRRYQDAHFRTNFEKIDIPRLRPVT